MMRKVWILALFISAVFAEVRIPEPWAPGRWDSARNPARMQNGFRLGLLWTEPMENLDYEVFGFAAEWGTEAYRFKAVFASSFLDSIYRSEDFDLEGAFAVGRFSLGFGGNADVQIVPGQESWWELSGRVGAFVKLPAHVEWGTWGLFLRETEWNVFGSDFFWKESRYFRSGLSLRYRRWDGFGVVLLQEMHLGALELQGEVLFPGPKVGVGIAFRWNGLGASFGMHRDADYMNSKMAGLFYDVR